VESLNWPSIPIPTQNPSHLLAISPLIDCLLALLTDDKVRVGEVKKSEPGI